MFNTIPGFPPGMSAFNVPSSMSSNYASNQTSNAPDFDKLEYLINKKIQDPEKAEAIRKVYETHLPDLLKVWDGFGSSEFRSWLVDESKFLGALSVDHIDLALRTFPTRLLTEFRQTAGYTERTEALTKFVNALQDAWGKQHKELIPLPPVNGLVPPVVLAMMVRRTVVVLYRKCGNGHLMASEGIKQLLEKKGYKVHLLNGGDFESNTVFNSKFSKYTAFPTCRTQMTDLRNRVKQLHPDLIINTVAHHNRWTQLAYDLEVPELVVHTDYEVNESVVDDDGACKTPYVFDNSSLIQYCLPHEDTDVNRASMKNTLSAARYKNLVKETGFPVREPFQREIDPTKIAKLRTELGFQGDERAVLMLGHVEPDTTTMIDLINQLRSSKRSFAAPLCIVAVCGKDPGARQKLEGALKTMPSHPDIRIKIEGYLDDAGMAKYMKVASRVAPFPGVMVSKRGGSTTAEATEMGVYTIGLPTLSQEECNGRYTQRHGLGEPYIPILFVDQVSNAVKWKGNPNSVYKSPFDWKTNLLDLVQKKIYESTLSRLGLFQFTTGNTA